MKFLLFFMYQCRTWRHWLVSIVRNFRPIYRKCSQLYALKSETPSPDLANRKQKLLRELHFLIETDICQYNNLAEFVAASRPVGRFSILHEGLRFDCIFRPQPGERLFVILSGLRSPKRHPIPKFDRLTLPELFPGNVLYISDPCHYLDGEKPQTSWYLGTENANAQQGLLDIVLHVAQSQGLATKQIIPYGSSAGGFASMMLAAALGDATAVAINCQTTLWHFQPRGVFLLFLKTCFPSLEAKNVLQKGDERFNALLAIERSPNMRCLYVQNTEDAAHWQPFFLPLCERFGLDPNAAHFKSAQIETLVYSHESGHGGEPIQMVPEILSHAVQLAARTK